MKGKKSLSLVLVMSILCSLIVALPVTAGAVTGEFWDGTVATGFGGGNGTADDPYQIYNGSQLAYLAQSVNNGTSYSGKFIKLMNDIVLNDTSNWESWDETAPKNSWTAIGTSSKYFQGTFDGDGHTVSGIYINSSANYQGLFGNSPGIIKNVGVVDSYIHGSSSVGGVVGNNSYGTVTDCYNTGIVTGNDYVGGVTGRGSATNCYNTGIVTGNDYVGGVVGESLDTANCYNTGSVTGSGYDVGGVVGNNYPGRTVTNCYNTGSVTGSRCVGGVVGYNWSGNTVTDCYNAGNVTGNESVGGVVGSNKSSSTVTNCYNTGIVTGNESVGGVVGYTYKGTVENCYNTGSVTGSHFVGGVVGSNSDGTVENCYNTGSVTGNSFSVGGVVGRNDDTVTDCYYLSGCAIDGSGVVQYGIGNSTKGKTTADVSGQTTGLTDAQMKEQSSFVGFDFDTVWTMAGNSDYPYPELIGLEYIGEFEEPSEPETSEIWDGTVATGFGGGNGTADDPYQIYNGSQLAYLAQTTNNGTNYIGKYIKLMNDIVLNDTSDWEEWEKIAPKNEWNAIGTSSKSFQGTFDGDGHTVSGIYINSTSDYQGLFGYVNNSTIDNNSTIENVGVIDSYISGRGSVGGVVGFFNSGTVTNCYNTGSVTGSGRVGGVVGHNPGSVTNCYNTGSVTGNYYYVGGVVGDNWNCGTVQNCYNSGSVTGYGDVGGVTGGNGGTVENCYNTGSVSGSYYVGGVAGMNNGTVENCYNTGSVSGSGYEAGGVAGDNGVGGVAGYKYEKSTVTDCYYLSGCAKDGSGVVQYGIGNSTKGKTTADISGQTTGLTDAQMKLQASFVGFDFDTVWTMAGNSDYPYPELIGMNHGGKPEEPTEPETSEIWDGTVATGFGGGNGTEDDPYQIYNGSQLAYLAQSVNNGTSYSGEYFKLMNDIVLNDTSDWEAWEKIAPKNEWTAIGTSYDYPFQGTFDGDEHTVSGIYINSTSDYQGLFGYSAGTLENSSTIKNIGVIDSYIKGNQFVGGVVGSNHGGTINNSYNMGSVIGDGNVGGIVGHVSKDSMSGIIKNCFNGGDISGTDDVIGGIVGICYGGTVTECFNIGNVNGTGINMIGGIVGDNYYGIISKCYNLGKVNGITENLVGGVAGRNYRGNVSNCFNSGIIIGRTKVGGVIGYSGDLSYYSKVTNCYNTGSVTGSEFVGGVVGKNLDGLGTNCYYLSDCAKDGIDVVQYGIGNETQGKTTGDVSGKTTGLTETEMKSQASFVGFDFDKIWTMAGNPDYPYPELIGLEYIGTIEEQPEIITINSINSNIDLGNIEKEIAFSSLSLPSKVTAQTEKGIIELSVNWEEGGYNSNTIGVQIVVGVVSVPTGYELADNLSNEVTATITVTEKILDSGICGVDVYWTLYADGLLKLTGTGDMYDYQFMSSPWYSNLSNIKTIEISNGITGIGDYSFMNCDKVSTVLIPTSLERVGICAFFGCQSLDTITLPNSVFDMSAYAFSYCSSLGSLILPKNLTEIEEYAFSSCSNLKEIRIPDGVTKIGNYAFYDCRKLETVHIPDSVIQIGENSFDGCDNSQISSPDGSYAMEYAKRKNIKISSSGHSSGGGSGGSSATKTITPDFVRTGDNVNITITTENIPETAKIYFASYDEIGKLKEIKEATLIENSASAQMSLICIDKIKVFAWNDNLMPYAKCEWDVE